MSGYAFPFPPPPPPPGVDWWYRIQVPAQPWAVGQVRDSVRSALWRHGCGVRADEACLLASELVTNGIVHAKCPVSACLSGRCGSIVRIEVYDPAATLPQTRRAGADDEAGRGLALIDALAAAWGTRLHPRDGGKSVWCELSWPC
ncbi:ATP-binding protein [Streptomyces sp. 6N223]|uniref:ATP-binding protein n=1 Tax=Streptomyces sp. 6N223 TaxID=3457412 RepID=UPI003FD36DA9